MLRLDVLTGRAFGGDPVTDTDFGSVPLLSPLQNGDFRRFVNICRTVTTLGEVTDADKVMNPHHFSEQSGRHPDLNPD